MATEAASAEAPPPAKFSRYRSVRRAQAQQQQQVEQLNTQSPSPPPPLPTMPPVPPVPPVEPQKNATAGMSRSMSRYHRRPTTSHAPASKAPPLRSNTDIPPVPTTNAQATATVRTRATSSPHQTPHTANQAHPRLPASPRARGEPSGLVSKSGKEPSRSARDEAKQVLQEEAERQRRMQEKIKAEKRARLEAEESERRAREEAERKQQEQLRKEEEEAERLRAQREAEEAEQLRRLKEEQERGKRLQKAESTSRLKKREEEARKAQAASPPSSPPRHGGGFGFFHRKRKEDVPTSPESPASRSSRPRQTSDGKDRDLDTIRPGGGGAVLGIDAPISAVNAGDRRVMIVCNKQHIYLPVTPATTPLDLIKSASTVLTEPINVRTAVLLESFTKVGLKRPLRNYEHVRDVMNSWDDDKQNDLMILDSEEHGINQEELLSANVPSIKPGSFGCYIHYSSKPGKWSKRWLGLRNDGQLILSKNEDSKSEENLCHLSDFDIYTPTERKFAKIRPPKKICFAVKSQLKSNIYVDESRFVHFFCTNDRSIAADFHKNLHNWRSWYLKNVLGEGQKKKSPDAKAVPGTRVGVLQDQTPSHARNASVGSHYQLGTFSPLLDMDQFNKDDSKDEPFKLGGFPDDAPLSKLDSKAMHQRRMSTRIKGPPPLSYSMGTVTQDAPPPTANRQNSFTPSSNSQDDAEVFASGGLLGRTYSHRQRAMQEREQKPPSGPFTEGPSLINNMGVPGQTTSNEGGLNRRSSVRSTHHRRTSSDIQRSMSTRAMPKPLVDLTPQYKEPPQHARKGKGYHPEANTGPLVENATSLDEAIKVPSATDWRARPSTARMYAHQGPSERTRSLKGRGESLAAHAVNNHENVPEDSNNAFTGTGLLARAGFSQGNTPVGHGVMDGSKARGPMLDMREDSKFAAGSLLAGVQQQRGPVIDREK